MGKGPVTKCSFQPKRERYALKKLARTAALTVLANFFLRGDLSKSYFATGPSISPFVIVDRCGAALPKALWRQSERRSKFFCRQTLKNVTRYKNLVRSYHCLNTRPTRCFPHLVGLFCTEGSASYRLIHFFSAVSLAVIDVINDGAAQFQQFPILVG